MWSTFWSSFRQQARSPADWYRRGIIPTLHKLVVPLIIMLGIAVLGGWMGYTQVSANAPRWFANPSENRLSDLSHRLQEIPSLAQMGTSMNVPSLLFNNIRATSLMFLAGLVSFGVLGIIFYLINVGLIGAVISLFAYLGLSPLLVFAAGLLPHGLFELPALMLSGAAVLRMSAGLVTPQLGRSLGEVVIDLVADWARIFVGVVVPLLCVAAVIETYVTPQIITAVIR
jgi:stage II sporulation protein M